MNRMLAVGLVVAVIVGGVVLHVPGVSLAVALVAGALFTVRSLASSGGLEHIRISNTTPDGKTNRKKDPNAAIGTGIAAAGIAAMAMTDSHFPQPFRIFYGICLCVGSAIALITAWRHRAMSK